MSTTKRHQRVNQKSSLETDYGDRRRHYCYVRVVYAINKNRDASFLRLGRSAAVAVFMISMTSGAFVHCGHFSLALQITITY